METLLKSCDGGQKWHWYSIMHDLQNAGLEDVAIDPIPVGFNCFSGTYKEKMFILSWVKDTFMLVSMREEEVNSSEFRELVKALSKIVEYNPFCKYVALMQVTAEWDKIDPAGRRQDLEAEGKELLPI